MDSVRSLHSHSLTNITKNFMNVGKYVYFYAEVRCSIVMNAFTITEINNIQENYFHGLFSFVIMV